MIARFGAHRYPIVYFCVFSCLFGWSLFIARWFGAEINADGMPFGPVLGALLTTVLGGKALRTAWWKQIRKLKANAKWYFLALGAPALIILASVAVNTALGAPMPAAFIPSINFVLVFAVMFVMVGIGEELGWTAFMTPLLLRKKSFATTWVVLSGVRIVWHLPLMLTGTLPWVVGLGGVTAFQFIALWMFHRSRGAWILVALWHAMVNTTGGQYFFRMVSGDDQFWLGVIMTGAYVFVAILVFVIERNNFGAIDLVANVEKIVTSQEGANLITTSRTEHDKPQAEVHLSERHLAE